MKKSLAFKVHLATIISMVVALFSPSMALAAPSVGTLSPNNNLTAQTAIALSATVTSGTTLQYCHLYVDSENVGTMTVYRDSASFSYTFPAARVYTAFVFCKDMAGGMTAGANTSMNVTQGAVQAPVAPLSGSGQQDPDPEPDPEPTPEPDPEPALISEEPEPVLISETPEPALISEEPEAALVSVERVQEAASERLITLTCPEDAAPDHACKAVYFVGSDSVRHAFPNSKVYFTWYNNFDSVEIIDSEELSGFSLGKNITYRPGIRMVKFQTLNKVYAVTVGGTLRPIANEGIASSLYGTAWNTMIDDISDSFYTNYIFGDAINSVSEYTISSETSSAASISASF